MNARDVALRGGRALDARRYDDRLEMLRALSRAFPDATTGVDSPWSGSPEVGLEYQTKWQVESGRTFPDESGRASGWWAAVNYTLTVWPFLAVRRHLSEAFGGVEVRVPDEPAFELESRAADRWVEYFEMRRTVEALRADGEVSEETLERRARRLQSTLWSAHLHSVRVGRDRFRDKLGDLPEAERKFARMWGETTVEYLAALNAPTGSVVSGYFNRLLPDAVLEGDEVFGPQNHFRESERLMMSRLWEIHRYEKRHDYRLLEAIRAAEPHLREAGFFDHSYRALRRAIDDYRRVDLAAVLAAFFRYVGKS